MAVNFPSNPTNGDTLTVGGITYAYDSTQGVWSDNPQGLTQAIDALTDVDTSTSAPSNGQVLQWNSTDSEWQPADAGAGVTVYATIDDLPLTGVTEGSMALVDSTDKLYIYSDTGWYSISIVNQTPTISGVSATYTLATDGTATTVTVTATDPEGIPLTYSIVSDTSGSVATVAQGTGSNTNQWTITPSTNTADAGNFTLVFRASDGTNIASASSTFTLTFAPALVNNSKYTTALITSVGANNAVNDTFSWHTGTATFTNNGSVTQNTYSPLRSGGYSHLYRETVAESHASTLSAMGSSAWTIEAWFYRISGSGSGIDVALHVGAINSTTGFAIGLQGSTITFRGVGTTDSTFNIANTTDRWIHFAFVYDGTDLECFANGFSLGTATRSLNITDTSINIGYNYTTFSYGGYIKDVRASSVARYSSTFDAPTESFTSDTDTLFLLNNATLTDDSSNAGTISSSGSPSIAAFSPYDREEYDAADHGGSMYFDQSSYLAFPSNTTITMLGADQTVEFWALHEGSDGDAVLGSISDTTFYIGLDNGKPYIWVNSQTLTNISGYTISSGHTAIGNTTVSDGWHHYAFDIDRGASTTVLTVYVDGAVYGSLSWANTSLTARGVGRGLSSGFERYFVGYISGLRVVNSRVYTTAFDVPTTAPTAINGTQLLLNGTAAAIIDKSQSVKKITLNGDVKSSTAQTKYLTSSMYFDGTGDYLSIEPSDQFNFGSGDFTIEAWIYVSTSTSPYDDYHIIGYGTNSTNFWAIRIRNSVSRGLEFRWFEGTEKVAIYQGSNLTSSGWYHVAVTRNGNTWRMFFNGSLVNSATNSGTISNFTNSLQIGALPTVGAYYLGHISDVRITKGLARYTSNFTPPSAALEG